MRRRILWRPVAGNLQRGALGVVGFGALDVGGRLARLRVGEVQADMAAGHALLELIGAAIGLCYLRDHAMGVGWRAAPYLAAAEPSGRGLVGEECVDVFGELCGVLKEEAVCGVGVDLQFGLRDQPREQV